MRGGTRLQGLTWDWTEAGLGAAYALPAAAVALNDPRRAFALAVGVIPAAIIGLAPKRRARLLVVVLGFLTGVPIVIGSALTDVPVIAVAAIFGLAVGAVLLAQQRPRVGQIAMVLSLPMVGIGLSYGDLGQAVGLAALMVAGSAYACAVSLLWPETDAPPRDGAGPPPPTLEYGIRLGAAGASAAAIGFLADLEHVGWAVAAALLVMRPSAEMQRLRTVGRVLAVVAGTLAAIALVRIAPAAAWYSAAVIVAVTGAAGTRRSRWYVTAGFTTFLVFLLLLYSDVAQAGSRFSERLLETLLGVGLAYLFGLVVPGARPGRRPRLD